MPNKKYIITKMSVDFPDATKEPVLFQGLFDGDILTEVFCEKTPDFTELGTICIGRVENIVPSIKGAFIRIAPEEIAYLPLEEGMDGIFSKKNSSKGLCIGDELLVQVCREPLKTKGSAVTTHLQMQGKYMVLTTDSDSIQVSKKINGEQRNRLKNQFIVLKESFDSSKQCNASAFDFSFGVIVRTNAATADWEDIQKEFTTLSRQIMTLAESGIYKTLYSRLYVPESKVLQRIRDFLPTENVEIITDLQEVYSSIQTSGLLTDNLSLRLYKDTYSLDKLYSLSYLLHNALDKKVWLKSGAYLVIEPTEALTVIDVNSGKNIKNKKDSEFYLKINLEAEKEIMHQIALRNLNGIIVIDFIDMADKIHQQVLIDALKSDCKKERIPTSFIEMTRLNLAHITRKKVQQTLREQVKE